MRTMKSIPTKINRILLSTVLLAGSLMPALGVLINPQSALAFSGGDGTALAPYQISTCLQLQDMQSNLAAHYELATNVNCGDATGGNDSSTWNSGQGFVPVGDWGGNEFVGSFNGNGHTISNLYINRPTTDRQALFAYTNTNTIIENVGLVNVNITGMRYAAGIVAVLSGAGTILRNSYVTGAIALVHGDVTGSGQYAAGIVSGLEAGSTVSNSFSTATVDTYYPSGGEGGIAGFKYSSTVSNSFWDTEVSGEPTSDGGTGKTTLEMKTGSTFTDAGWDFTHIWNIDGSTNNGYPFLRGPGPLTPAYGSPTATTDGYTVETSNYDPAYTWSVTTNAGSASISGLGLVTVSGLTTASYATITVHTSKLGLPNGSNTLTYHSARVETSDTVITNCNQLLAIDDFESGKTKDYTLGNDIDCSAVTNFTPIGQDPEGWNGAYFRGIFDGKGHTISGIHINSDSYAGLFGSITDTTIRNVNLRNGSINATSGSDVGSIVGFAFNSSLENVSSDLVITAPTSWGVGGLAGYIESEPDGLQFGSVSNSYFTGQVTGSTSTGGIVGALDIYEGHSYTIRKSYSDAIVLGDNDIGGIAGSTNIGGASSDHDDSKALFVDTYSRSTVQATNNGAGGIIGNACSYTNPNNNKTTTEIDSSYSSGNVFAAISGAGGIIGQITCNNSSSNNEYKITNSFVAGRVETDSVHFAYGLIGGVSWHDGVDTFDFSNNVVDDSKAVVNGLATYYSDDTTKIVRTDSTDPHYFFGTQSNAPLNTWDFDNVWGAHATDYPTFLAGPAVVDLHSAENNSAIRIVQKGCDAIDTSSSSKESSLSVQDPAYAYPTGLVGFTMSGCDSTVAIRATFSGSFDLSKVVIRKYNSLNHSFTTLTAANSGLVISAGSLNGNPALRVDYNIVDNGPLDEDATVGKIKDPSGPALIIASVPNTGFGAKI